MTAAEEIMVTDSARALAEEAGLYTIEIQPWEAEALPYDLGIWVE